MNPTDEGWGTFYSGTLRACAQYAADVCNAAQVRTSGGWRDLKDWDPPEQAGWHYQESPGGDGRLASDWIHDTRCCFPLRTREEAYAEARGDR